MRSKISTPIAVVVIVLVVAVVGFLFWRSQNKPMVTDEKGVPIVPVEAKPGSDALRGLWQKGIMPPKTH